MGKITKKIVEGLAATPKSKFLWDSGDGAVKGFGVCIGPSGKKTFVAQYRIGTGRAAKSKRVKIGAFPTFTVEEAREAARIRIRDARDGTDIDNIAAAKKAAEGDAARAKAEEARRARDLVLTRVAIRFLRDHVRAKRKRNTIVAYRQILKQHILPYLGARDLRTIRRSDVADLHKRLT